VLTAEGSSGGAPTAEALETLEAALTGDVEALLAVADERPGTTIVVSNEVGACVVPEYPQGRTYHDLLGRVNQLMAAHASRAWLLVAGRALELPATDS